MKYDPKCDACIRGDGVVPHDCSLKRIRSYIKNAADGYVRPERSTEGPVSKQDLQELVRRIEGP